MAKTPNKRPVPTAPTTAKRGRGRPRAGQRVGTPENIERIRVMWLEGQSSYRIGAAIGCTHAAVQFHVRHTILPKQRTVWEGRIEEIVLKVEHLYEVAWQRFQASKRPEVMETLRAEELKAKLREAGVDKLWLETVTKAVTRSGEACWLDIVRWCLDWFSKVSGIYAAEKVELTEGLRVAGKSRAQIDEEVLGYLAARVAERKRHEALVEQMYGPQGGSG